MVAPVSAALPRPILVWALVAPLPLVAVGLDGLLSRLDGALLVAWFAVCMTGTALAGRALTSGPMPRRRRFAAARIVSGLALLAVGGHVFADGIGRVLARFDISESLLGNVPIAAAVEVEEVARVAVPAKRGRGDIALGGIFGTIIHFAALNAGVICLVRPIALDSASRSLYLPMTAGAVVLLVACVATRGGVSRIAGGMLLSVYAGYVAAATALGT